ncbi:MAG: hypothetical protein KJZ73_16200 [Pseudorhodoplanes sp.]|nr:hypothetical protein [Pseudorhodoplanes sp.]
MLRALHFIAVALALWLSPAAAADWQRISPSAPFAPRDTAHGFTFDGRMWLSNGWTHSGTPFRDLWSSDNGIDWRQELPETPYDAYSGMAVHNGAIIAANRAVWRSLNGRDWVQIGKTPLVRESSLPYLQSYNGKLYIFVVEGVWRSEDGVSWEDVETPETLKRGSYAIVQFNGAIWVLGGGKLLTADPPELGDPAKTSFNDIWRYTDAEGWRRVTASAPWGARMWPTAIVHEGRMFLVGGFDNRKRVNLDETWVSEDGLNWRQMGGRVRFSPRHWPTLFNWGGSILLVAGNGYPVQNDVWKLDLWGGMPAGGASSLLKNPSP